MWELICHHTYKLARLPANLSLLYENDGIPDKAMIDDDFLSDGAAPGSGAVRFPRPGCRIRVPPGKAWQPLGGIKVEVTARRSLPTSGQTLIAGHESFTFKTVGQYLFALFRGKSTLTAWGNSDGLDSFTDAVDFQPHPVPIGKWFTLGFLHDGLDTMQMFIDGQLVAQRTGLLAGIPPVGALGVSIGNEPDRDDSFFRGDIDEIRVWRPDVRAIEREFLSRPYDQATADCWERFFRRLRDALVARPDCAELLRGSIESILNRLRRAIVGKGPESRERYARSCAEYERLWRAGQLDSPEMARLIVDWCTWLRLVGISLQDDPDFQRLLQTSCLKEVLTDCASLECDPQMTAFIKLIADACGHDGAASA
jgi:hypothetical protein